MANENHVMILRCGVKIWNRWREANSSTKPELEWVLLEAASLPRADLRDANLYQSQLKNADLENCRLEGALVSNANLSFTNLKGANLTGANLEMADLNHANLSRATLDGAHLRRTNLQSACLEAASIVRAVLTHANLRGCWSAGAKIDRIYLGEPEDVIVDPAFQGTLSWQRVFIGEAHQFDPDHDPVDSAYWLTRKSSETVYEAIQMRLSGSLPNSIHLTFQESVWRDLVVIETGLRELFGEGVETKKTDGALTVSFQSTEALKEGLGALLVQLAAKALQGSEEVASLVVQAENEEDRVVLSQEDLNPTEDLIVRSLAQAHQERAQIMRELQERKASESKEEELSPLEEAALMVLGDLKFAKYLSPWVRRWLQNPDKPELVPKWARGLFDHTREGMRWIRRKPPALGDGVENAEVLEESAEGRLLGDGTKKE